ncbi:MAG: hypothetical protein ACREU7_16710, partial [Burkholderiales bacterium]
MRSMFSVMLLILFCGPAPLAGQPSGQAKNAPVAEVSAADPQPQLGRPPFPREEDDPIRQDMEKRRKKALNKARFTELKRDTDKLLQLAT